MSETEWFYRERKLASGRIERWREREVEPGVFERVFDDDGGQERISAAQPVTVRESA